MSNLNKLEEVEMLPLSNDYVFKRIFGKGGNEKILKSLLEAILKINIQKIELKNPEIPKETINEKLSILDIKAEINDNTMIDIELQVGNTVAIERRLVVYNAKMIAGEIKVSEKYQKAKDTIVICIINDNVVKRNAYLSLAMLKYEKTEEIRYVNIGYEKEEEYLTDMVKYYIIELPKFKKKKPKVADLLEKWLYVIGGDQKMMEEYKKENEEIKEAIEQLKEMSADEYERELYEIRERSRLTYNTEMNEARRKGLAEGKVEEKKEIAKLVILNEKNEILKIHDIAIGGTNFAEIGMKDVLSEPIKMKAPKIILVHNHPTGDCTPSKSDITITERLYDAAQLLGIKLLDHIVIGDMNYTSIFSEMISDKSSEKDVK